MDDSASFRDADSEAKNTGFGASKMKMPLVKGLGQATQLHGVSVTSFNNAYLKYTLHTITIQYTINIQFLAYNGCSVNYLLLVICGMIKNTVNV